mgnify:CR=1 FL=1
MNDKIITLLVGVLIALGGWTLTRTFDLSTNQVVSQEKVQKLELQVTKLTEQMDKVKDKEEEIIEQHKKLFDALDKSQSSTGYSYN